MFSFFFFNKKKVNCIKGKDKVLLHWNGCFLNVDIYVDLDRDVGKIFKEARGRTLGISPNATFLKALNFPFILGNVFN